MTTPSPTHPSNAPLEPVWADVAPLGPVAQVAAITVLWNDELTNSSAERMSGLAARFARRLDHAGVDSLCDATTAHCRAFIAAPLGRSTPPAPATMHLRRTVVRSLYRSIAWMGGPDLDPTRAIDLPPRTVRIARPLDDDEIVLVRVSALAYRARRVHAPAVVALAEATASTGEIPQIRWAQLDLAAGRVELPGAGRVQPRVNPLTPWGHAVLRAHYETRRPAMSDLVAGFAARGPQQRHSPQAAAVRLVRHLLDAATLAGETDIKPASLRLWAAARLLRDGATIDQAARALGLRSLDAAADALGWQWDNPA